MYQEAALQGSALSQKYLGGLYYTGRIVSQDYDVALKWYHMAAEQGDVISEFQLGLIYKDGHDVERDLVEAVKWLSPAADQGHASAQNALAWLLATSVDDNIRDGQLAIQYALGAVENRKDFGFVDTLADAYAEAGQFEKAVETQKEVISMVTEDHSTFEEFVERLKGYENSEPWREDR